MNKFIFILLFFTTIIQAKFIDLKKTVITDSDVIYYQDITEYNLPDKYKKIVITRSPFRKNEKIITVDQITKNLRQKGIYDYLPNKNYDQIIIKNRTAILKKEEQQNLIKNEIEELIAEFAQDYDYRYEIKSDIQDFIYPARNKIAIEVTKRKRYRAGGNQLFHIEIRLNDKFYKRIFINTYISIIGNDMSATTNISRGDEIILDNFIEKKMEITGFENEIISKKQLETNDYIATKLIFNGKVLTESSVRQKPDIPKGNIVNLQYKNNQIKISLPAMAIDDGFIGEISKFRILKYDKIYSCIVIDNYNAVINR